MSVTVKVSCDECDRDLMMQDFLPLSAVRAWGKVHRDCGKTEPERGALDQSSPMRDEEEATRHLHKVIDALRGFHDAVRQTLLAYDIDPRLADNFLGYINSIDPCLHHWPIEVQMPYEDYSDTCCTHRDCGNFMEGSYVAVPHDENEWERWQG